MKIDFATLLLLNKVKHSSTVYPMHVQSAVLTSLSTLIFCTSTAKMPPQTRAPRGFAGVAVEIDLILKGIKTRPCRYRTASTNKGVKTDLILKGPPPHP